jgi:hypothetical protein
MSILSSVIGYTETWIQPFQLGWTLSVAHILQDPVSVSTQRSQMSHAATLRWNEGGSSKSMALETITTGSAPPPEFVIRWVSSELVSIPTMCGRLFTAFQAQLGGKNV